MYILALFFVSILKIFTFDKNLNTLVAHIYYYRRF